MIDTPNKPLDDLRNNPFLEHIDGVLTDRDLHARMWSSPLEGFDMRSIGLQTRYDLLDLMDQKFFAPSLTSTDCATRLYTMVRKGYVSRNPTNIAARRRAMAISRYAGESLNNLPWLPGFARGMRVSGITGLGKTYEIRRAMEQLPPCISHSRSEAADWTHFYQVPILYVGMSHDGSVGGLLFQMLVALDTVLGTDYSMQRRLTSLTVEKLAVQVGILLSNHAVGALIIDEIQASNFSDGARGTVARTFFLRLLNFGIPLVLIGNPLGMQFISTFTQDVRRFSSGGTIELHPFERSDENYTNLIAPAFWGYNVMPEPPRLEDPDGAILFEYSGGIRDFAGRLIASAQRIALDLESTSINREHLDQAFSGPDFSQEERTLIRAFCKKDAVALQQFSDIPWETYHKIWTPEVPTPTIDKPPEAMPRSPKRTSQTSAQIEAAKIVAKRTRQKNKDASREKTKGSLGTSDIRGEGIKKHLVTSLAEVVDNPAIRSSS